MFNLVISLVVVGEMGKNHFGQSKTFCLKAISGWLFLAYFPALAHKIGLVLVFVGVENSPFFVDSLVEKPSPFVDRPKKSRPQKTLSYPQDYW